VTDELAVLKKVVGKGLFNNSVHVKVREPKSYDGARNTNILGNFVCDMEQYLD